MNRLDHFVDNVEVIASSIQKYVGNSNNLDQNTCKKLALFAL